MRDFVVDEGLLAAKFSALLPHLDERQRRLALGAEARVLGHGGIRAVARAAGVSEPTVAAGVAELEAGEEPLGRARRPGGGRKSAAEADPGLVPALLALIEPDERGDPGSPLRWTVKSTRTLAAELTRRGHPVSAAVTGALLREQGFSLQGNAKVIGGSSHPDRDAQFRYINETARGFRDAGDPVISVDAKKKELVGNYAGQGREYRPKGSPRPVRDHDFPDPGGAGTVIPYGIYDLAANAGWVNVGTDHDTAAFAAESIRRWWHGEGRDRYPAARRLLITADAGGSNSYRTRAWKAGLAALAAETGLEITCCHFPPGTSKWNKIEHRLFSHITMNWRARPLASHQVIVSLIAATTTRAGLTVTAGLDPGAYPAGVRISDAEHAALPLTRHGFRGEWNYTLRPEPPPAPAPAPPRPSAASRTGALRCPRDTLSHPALTGMPRDQLGHLTATLAIPWQADREARLYRNRGGPSRRTGGYPSRYDLTDHILATLLRHRLGLTTATIATLMGTDKGTISRAITRTLPVLRQHGITIEPAATLRTLASLRDYARTAGITIETNTPT